LNRGNQSRWGRARWWMNQKSKEKRKKRFGTRGPEKTQEKEKE